MPKKWRIARKLLRQAEPDAAQLGSRHFWKRHVESGA